MCPIARRRRSFSTELKREAVQLSLQSGNTVQQVASDLGTATGLLGKWRGLSRDEGGKAFPGHGNPRDEGVARLKRELTQVKHERIYRRRYRTHQEARTDVFESIEVRPNAERRAQL